jgi:enamine deaminase RidA (YjgF/YER057c/UK114 family)
MSERSRKQAFPGAPQVPISRAVRAGDFVFTSAYGGHIFDPKDVTFDADGNVLADGSGREGADLAEQVHACFAMIKGALAVAGCTLDDVVDCQCWLADRRDFVAFNEIYRQYFTADPPTRSVFRADFMFACKVELKVVAWKPVAAS